MSPARQDREQLILDHLHLVEKIARVVMGIYTHHIDFQELVACGRLGLVKAAAAYRAERGNFSHFCWFYIRGSMIDANKRAAFRDATHARLETRRSGASRSAISQARTGNTAGWQANTFWTGFEKQIDPPAGEALPDALAERREAARTVARAIAALPQDQRLVLVRSLRGEELAATAQVCGRSLTWTRGRLRVARGAVAATVKAGLQLQAAKARRRDWRDELADAVRRTAA